MNFAKLLGFEFVGSRLGTSLVKFRDSMVLKY